MRVRRILSRPRLLAAAAALLVAVGLGIILVVTAGGSAPRLTATNAAMSAPNATAVSRCLSQNMQVWIGVGPGEQTAGSTYYPLEFTNRTGQTCYLYGYPGVSVLKDGHQQGNAAGRATSTVRTVYLGPGATAHATLRVTNVSDFPSAACKPVVADTVRVYAPGAFNPNYVPFAVRACSAGGAGAPVYLQVSAVTAGTGVPGQP